MFVIKRAEKVDIFGSDDIISYGQKVKIECSPHAYRKKLYLSSTPKGTAVYSPVVRNQEASMNAYDSYNTTWVIEAVDPNYRLEKQGEPVLASDSILLHHCQTKHFLASDLNNYKTTFGLEYEVMAHSFHALNKT